jgi:hypothetical protein
MKNYQIWEENQH